MKPIKTALWLLLAVFSSAWLLADSLLPEPFTYFNFRTVFVQYSGVLGMAMMSMAMLLAVRPAFLEQRLHGLDKMYRLHKWLGIGGLLFSVLHWWWAQGSKWMVSWGWLAPPQRHEGPAPALGELEQLLRDQRGLAESVGEWAFYAAALLIVLALLKRVPYGWFRKLHTWLAVSYLVLVYHSVVLVKFDYWSQPVGWLLGLLMLAGTFSAIWVLTGRVGASRKASGVITALTPYPALRALQSTITLDKGWKGHQAGQFALVTSSSSEGAHPYTIASAWDPQLSQLTFIIKELGDWTGQLGRWLKVGMPVTVEGPYGAFDFEDGLPRQIWVGAGIGITPFMAKLEERARHPATTAVDLFHVTAEHDPQALARLQQMADAAGVRLHLLVSARDGRLTPDEIRHRVPEWRLASLWFCGPAPFGATLRRDFLNQGMPAAHYHQELFEMR